MDALTAMKQALECIEIHCQIYPTHVTADLRTAIEENEIKELEGDLEAAYKVINHSRERYDLLHKENLGLRKAMLYAASILEAGGDEYGVGYVLRREEEKTKNT